MPRFYHVVHPAWKVGDPLRSWDILNEMGISPEWRWEGEPEELDSNKVSMVKTKSEAEEFQRDYGFPGSHIVAIDVPDDVINGEKVDYQDPETGSIYSIKYGINGEGYPSLTNVAPEEWVNANP